MRQRTNYFVTEFLSGDSILVREDDNRTRKQHQVFAEPNVFGAMRYFTLGDFDIAIGQFMTNPVINPPDDIRII